MEISINALLCSKVMKLIITSHEYNKICKFLWYNTNKRELLRQTQPAVDFILLLSINSIIDYRRDGHPVMDGAELHFITQDGDEILLAI